MHPLRERTHQPQSKERDKRDSTGISAVANEGAPTSLNNSTFAVFFFSCKCYIVVLLWGTQFLTTLVSCEWWLRNALIVWTGNCGYFGGGYNEHTLRI